jgi:competence protein ComEC
MSDFNRTGTTHIVAVSGYNLTIVITYIALFLGIFSRKLKFWGSVFMIVAFVIMTGAPASVVRAGILAGLVALGHFEGRRVKMTILLLLVAAVMLSFNPYALKYDISFQLSFLAFAGLVYLGPIIAKIKLIRSLPNILKSSFCETMAAQIFVLPILIFYFGRVSVVSPIVNILILWMIPTAMGLIFAVGLAGLIWLSFGQVVGYLGWLLLKYIIVVVESFSKIPWAAYELKTAEWWWMIIYYGVLGLIIYQFRHLNQAK